MDYSDRPVEHRRVLDSVSHRPRMPAVGNPRPLVAAGRETSRSIPSDLHRVNSRASGPA
jgi:hypothetical protein